MARGNFGERLKRERELRDVSLEEITSATRIGSRFLNALENEDWDKLPGGVFNRGFVRSIARYLGLDEEAFLAEYDLAHNAQVPQEPPRPENPIPSPPRWIPVAVVLGALVLLVALVAGGIYGWRYFRARRSHPSSIPTSIASPQITTPPVTPALTTPASTEPSLDLTVSTSAPSHILVQADGYVVFDSDMQAGQTHHFFAVDGFQVSASQAGAVLLQLNGQVIPSLGSPGSSGTIKLTRNDLRQASSGNPRPGNP